MRLIAIYKQRLNLQNATFSRIHHVDAMVAIVYKITQPTGNQLILKICPRAQDYFREVYFLKHFMGALPIPRVIQVVPPEVGIDGAILMEYFPGRLLKKVDVTDVLAYKVGTFLARIHLGHTNGYGDLTQSQDLNPDPRIHFTTKFEEGFAECSNHLPKVLLQQCYHYFDTHIYLLTAVDGPCIIHRDFRPGNIIIHEGKIQGIIDWASARASFAEEDFCPLEHGEWSANATIKKSLLTGYASIRPIPPYHRIMPLLRLSRAIATIGFTIKQGTWQSSHASVYQFNRQFLDTFLNAL